MAHAYVDTSALLGILFEEAHAAGLAEALDGMDSLRASLLVEAELSSALRREGLEEEGEGSRAVLDWFAPDGSLTTQLEEVLDVGYLRGADLFIVACALWLAPEVRHRRALHFVSLDANQRAVAAALGFPLLPVWEA